MSDGAAAAGEGEGTKERQLMEKQLLYRENVLRFFGTREHYERLDALVSRGDMGPVLFFFVKHFEHEKFIKTRFGIFCIADAYRSALTSNMKRYFDFISREGRGDLKSEGACNPCVEIARPQGIPPGPSILLPLPRLVAYQWLISNEFDKHFWLRHDDIQVAFAKSVLDAKQRYQEANQRRQTVSSTSSSTPSAVTPKRLSERDRMKKNRSRRDKNARATVLEAREDGDT
jgi:hypothetical protein